jgi:dUTP pyrophosphatase
MQLKVKKLHKDAQLPTKAFAKSALDIYALNDVIIHPGEVAKVPTGIAIQLPEESLHALLWDKFSLIDKGLHTVGGFIEQDYTGHIVVHLYNTNVFPILSYLATRYTFPDQDIIKKVNQLIEENTIKISKGDKIAQLLMVSMKNYDPTWTEFLDITDRGHKGFKDKIHLQ